MKQIAWSWFDHRTDVPQWLAAGVGQIAIEWSVLERELAEAIRLLMDTDIRTGRIVTTGMNMRTRVTVTANFIQSHIYESKLPANFLIDFDKISTLITELESNRNRFVHGLWDKRKGQWRVLQMSAARKAKQLEPELKKLSRSVLPEHTVVTEPILSDLSRKIVDASKQVEAICTTLSGALPPSQHTPPKYTRHHRSGHARSPKARSIPPRS